MLRSWFKRRREPATESALTQSQQLQWNESGFLVLPGFFDSARVSELDREVESIWKNDEDADNPLVVDVLEGERNGQRRRLRDLPTSVRHLCHKLNDLYLYSETCRSLVLDERLVAILRALLDDEPVAINSLNFMKGSRQPYHFDTYYMPPPVEGQMAVTSICLEDVHPDAGPLMYYPGSHKIPPYRFPHGGLNVADEELAPAVEYIQQKVEDAHLESQTFCGKRGDVFIWHAQLYHGGSPIKDPNLTRRSIVTHYWGKTGMSGNIAKARTGGLYLNRDHPRPNTG